LGFFVFLLYNNISGDNSFAFFVDGNNDKNNPVRKKDLLLWHIFKSGNVLGYRSIFCYFYYCCNCNKIFMKAKPKEPRACFVNFSNVGNAVLVDGMPAGNVARLRRNACQGVQFVSVVVGKAGSP